MSASEVYKQKKSRPHTRQTCMCFLSTPNLNLETLPVYNIWSARQKSLYKSLQHPDSFGVICRFLGQAVKEVGCSFNLLTVLLSMYVKYINKFYRGQLNSSNNFPIYPWSYFPRYFLTKRKRKTLNIHISQVKTSVYKLPLALQYQD